MTIHSQWELATCRDILLYAVIFVIGSSRKLMMQTYYNTIQVRLYRFT